jgi:arylsulfatase A-like enzyme
MPRALACLALLCLLPCFACGGSDRLVLLISVDTLRVDRLGAYGSELGLTPHLDALAARSTQFNAAYAPAPFTLPSLSSLLTGRHPIEIGMLGNHDLLSSEVPTLAAVLQERGWRTGAVVSNYILRRACGLDRGFELYDDDMLQHEAVRKVPERVADATTDAALAMLDQLRAEHAGDTLLWVHYQDPHGPYTPPDGYRERQLEHERSRPDGRRELEPRSDNRGAGGIPAYQYLEGERQVGFYRAGYDGEVRFSDEQIGRLLGGLQERGLFERAVILFVADHGEGLGERDYWFAHGEQLTDPMVRVPLLLRLPGEPHRQRDEVVGLQDVLPTLMSLLDVSEPPASSGRDLLAAGSPGRASSVYMIASDPTLRIGLVDGDHKLILTPLDGGFAEELYLRGQEDVDRSLELARVAAALRRRLAELHLGMEQLPPIAQPDMTAEDLARLRALGYAEEPEPAKP